MSEQVESKQPIIDHVPGISQPELLEQNGTTPQPPTETYTPGYRSVRIGGPSPRPEGVSYEPGMPIGLGEIEHPVNGSPQTPKP